MGSTVQRSFLKGVSWELISFFITFEFVYFYYGNVTESLRISLYLSLFKIFIFFAHERLWKRIKWGKIGNKAL